MVGSVKAASMVMDDTMFRALINRVEYLEIDGYNSIVQLGNMRIENL